jgi:hypothetical protein
MFSEVWRRFGFRGGRHLRLALAATSAAFFVGLVAVPSFAVGKGPVTYTARRWLPGLKVIAGPGWTVYEDQPGEFSLKGPNRLGESYIHFWLDPRAAGPLGAPLAKPVGRSPGALIKWLRGNRNLVVSLPMRRVVAGSLPTTTVKLDLSPRAPREDPTCTAPCLTYFVFRGPGYDFPFGTARGELVKLYLGTVRRDGQVHTLEILVSASAKFFKQVTAITDEMLSKTKIPPNLTP